MERTLHIGTYFNIPVKVHWSFGLLLLFVLYVGITNNLSTIELTAFALYIIVLFLCVILHEFGHALMAGKFGTKTRDIIISPIGGVARLESIPEEPYKELLIAFAGPMINVFIGATTAFVTIILFSGSIFPSNPSDFTYLKYPSEFIRYITLLNTILFFFNLIPAFPMDGGRVLRAILSMGMDRYKATKIASYVGKGFAFAFIAFGIYHNNMFLGLVGLFVYFAAGAEFKNLQLVRRMKELKAGEVMKSGFKTFSHYQTIGELMAYSRQTSEKNFLILDENEKIIGTMPSLFIEKYNGSPATPIMEIMSFRKGHVEKETSLYEVYNYLNGQGLSIAAVQDEGEIIGVIDRDTISAIMEDKVT